MSTNRLEAFSDGVIAIAITLLVLDIHVPDPGRRELGAALAHQWPNYAAYVISFLTIGIVWINHHAAIARIRQVDHGLLTLNLLLLLTIGFIPFSTALMAAYLREEKGEHLAAAVYGGSFFALACAFFALHAYVMNRRPELLIGGLDERSRRSIVRRNGAGLLPYLLAVVVSPLSSYATLGICAAVAAFYALPGTTAPGG